MKRVVLLGLMVCFSARPPAAGAQVAPTGSTAGNPAVAAQRAATDLDLNRTRDAARQPPAPAPVVTATQPRAAAPSDRTGPAFLVSRIHFDGNTVVTTADLAALAAPHEGRLQHLGDLRVLAARVQALYQSRGYFLARAVVPAQELGTGVVRITVLEGRFGETKIEGARHHSTRFIDRFFAPARRGGVVREGPVTRALLVLNELPDMRVQSVIERGSRPGTADFVLRVSEGRPWHVLLDYNNHGNRLVGRNRAGAALNAGSVVAEGDDLLLRITEPFPTPGDPYLQAGYSVPLGNRGGRLGYQFASARTRVGGSLAILDIRGDAKIHGLAWTRPLERTLARATNLTLALSVKTIQNFVFGDTLTSEDNLRTMTLGYGGSLYRGKERTFHSSLITQGLGTALGGDRNGHALASRQGSGNQFTKLNSDWIHARQMTAKDLLLLRAGFQLSTEPLPTAEQFGIGGPDSVRGFIQSEFLGDQGHGIGAEYDRTLVEKKRLRVQAATFIERAEASLLSPGAGERGSKRLVGAGVGLRAGLGADTSVKLDIGFPLSQSRNIQGDDAMLYAFASTRY